MLIQHGEARAQPETSAGDDVNPRPSVTVPFVGEIRSLLAVKDVMYPQTTAVRRRLLNVRYRIARDEDRGLIDSNAPVRREALRGATIQINRSPFEIPDDYRSGADAPAARAQAAIAKLGERTRDSWAAEADRNRRVKTTCPGWPRSARSRRSGHGYVLTMVTATSCSTIRSSTSLSASLSRRTRRRARLVGALSDQRASFG